jgi:Flp pilus assembly protein TadD/TolB-like protein
VQVSIGVLAITAITAVVFVYASRRKSGPAPAIDGRPLIAVTDIANLRGDTASQWLEDGLAQMISAELGRGNDVEVVTPARVRDTRLRAELPMTGVLPSDAALDIARRLGATVVVRGGFTHGGGQYVLDLDVRDAKDGRDIRSFTVRGTDPMSLADQASGRIIASNAGGATGARFADIETSNLAAYQHFVRALQADAEGRREDSRRELDASIALDSGFASALAMRVGFAIDEGDTRTQNRLRHAIQSARFTARDLLAQAIDSATHNGELQRAEQLTLQLVRQYPHDPRSYSALAGLYADRGDWTLYDATEKRELALDSLAEEAGAGPCVPCSVYSGVVEGRTERGDLAGAEEAARRWILLQPDLPGAWASLAIPLAYAGRFDAALDADRRAELLSGNDPIYSLRIARDLVLARRFDQADSLARSWRADTPQMRDGAADIKILVLRERGQFRASIRETEQYSDLSGSMGLTFEEVDAYARLGDYAGAAKLWRARMAQTARETPADALHGDVARAYTWSRAIEANSIAGAGDTLQLRAIADSMRRIGSRSYYGRDWKLYNHVLGLIAMQGHRYAEAERDFSASRWGTAGWTETVAWLAKAQLAQHRPADAIATLRDAYMAPVDAMGRYEPRSELDYLMAISFAQAGLPDSASVYGAYARTEWRDADPEIKRQLASLPSVVPVRALGRAASPRRAATRVAENASARRTTYH